jgi:hypothetical protein
MIYPGGEIMANRIKCIRHFRLLRSALRGDGNGCCWGGPGLGPGIRIEAVDTRRSTLCTDIRDQAFFLVGVIDDLAYDEVTFP